MTKRSLLTSVAFTVAAVVLFGGALAASFANVTFVMKNGDRVSGVFSYNHTDHYQIVVDGRQRDFPSDDIAMIAFAPGDPAADELNKLPEGNDPPELERHTIVLRSGEMVRGKIWDFQGDRIIMDIHAGDRRTYNMGDTARLYISAPGSRRVYASVITAAANAAAAKAAAAKAAADTAEARAAADAAAAAARGQGNQGQGQGQGRGQNQGQGQGRGQNQGQGQGQGQGQARGQWQTIVIPANQCWVRTGIFVDQNQDVTFEATGQIQLSADRNDIAGPGGSLDRRYSRLAPAPDLLLGTIIGRIDNRRVFEIGDITGPIAMRATGELWIGINDDRCQDNRGEFRVRINDRR